MSHAASLAARRRLEQSWSAKNYAACSAILDEILPANDTVSVDPDTLESVIHALRSMTVATGSAEDGIGDAFGSRRDALFRAAAASSNELRIAIESDAIAAHDSGPEWATALFNYVMLRGRTVGAGREPLWETVAFIHWAAGQLLRHCRLDETGVANLLMTLLNADMHLGQERGEPSILKIVMQEDRKTLQDAFVAVLSRLAQAGQLTEPESFLAYDIDGRLATALAPAIGKLGLRHPNSVALAYFDTHIGAMPADTFLAAVAPLPCMVIGDGTAFIVAGDVAPSVCRRLTDIEHRPSLAIHLTWWLNVNFPREQLGDAGFMVSRVPPHVRSLLAQGQATLVLAAMGEASWFTPQWVGWMDGLADALSCRPERIVYLCQNARFPEDYRAYRRQAPRGRFGAASFNAHLLTEGLRAAPRPAAPTKHFLCFNQRPHLHRVALLLGMKRDGLLDRAHVSFNQPIAADRSLTGEALAPWLGMSADDADTLIEGLAQALPMRLDLAGRGVGTAVDAGYVGTFRADLFADAAFYLVTETEMDGPSMCRFTEKTVKGLAAEIPFIVFGNAGVLASLRALGFRTFAPLVDERYDTIEEPVARFHAAYAEVRRLAAMPLEALVGMRAMLQPVLQHNRATLLSIGPTLHDRLAADLENAIGL